MYIYIRANWTHKYKRLEESEEGNEMESNRFVYDIKNETENQETDEPEDSYDEMSEYEF